MVLESWTEAEERKLVVVFFYTRSKSNFYLHTQGYCKKKNYIFKIPNCQPIVLYLYHLDKEGQLSYSISLIPSVLTLLQPPIFGLASERRI